MTSRCGHVLRVTRVNFLCRRDTIQRYEHRVDTPASWLHKKCMRDWVPSHTPPKDFRHPHGARRLFLLLLSPSAVTTSPLVGGLLNQCSCLAFLPLPLSPAVKNETKHEIKIHHMVSYARSYVRRRTLKASARSTWSGCRTGRSTWCSRTPTRPRGRPPPSRSACRTRFPKKSRCDRCCLLFTSDKYYCCRGCRLIAAAAAAAAAAERVRRI